MRPRFKAGIYRDGSDDFGTIEGFAIIADIQASLGQIYGASTFVVDDANGDLIDDLITIGSLGSATGVAVFFGQASGEFALPTSATAIADIDAVTMSGQYRDLTSGDFDTDGNIDIAISYGDEFVQIQLGDGMGGFTDQGPLTVGRRTTTD